MTFWLWLNSAPFLLASNLFRVYLATVERRYRIGLGMVLYCDLLQY